MNGLLLIYGLESEGLYFALGILPLLGYLVEEDGFLVDFDVGRNCILILYSAFFLIGQFGNPLKDPDCLVGCEAQEEVILLVMFNEIQGYDALVLDSFQDLGVIAHIGYILLSDYLSYFVESKIYLQFAAIGDISHLIG